MLFLILISQSIETYIEDDESDYDYYEEKENYIFSYKQTKDSSTIIKIKGIDNALVEIQNENGNTIYKSETPVIYRNLNFKDGFYKIIIKKGNSYWSNFFELKRGFEYNLYIKSF